MMLGFSLMIAAEFDETDEGVQKVVLKPPPYPCTVICFPQIFREECDRRDRCGQAVLQRV
jgi:hypothetical protein